MTTFIMLTRLAHGSLNSPRTLEDLEKTVKARIDAQCRGVRWLANYAVFGPYDYVDIFEAPDLDSAAKVSAIIRTFGHAHTEIWPATPWSHFKDMIRDIPALART
jgi:uncharacterized protein with GYD domain